MNRVTSGEPGGKLRGKGPPAPWIVREAWPRLVIPTLICGEFVSPLPRLVLENGVLFVTFFGILLFVAGQKSLYLDLLTGLKQPSPVAETISASA